MLNQMEQKGNWADVPDRAAAKHKKIEIKRETKRGIRSEASKRKKGPMYYIHSLTKSLCLLYKQSNVTALCLCQCT